MEQQKFKAGDPVSFKKLNDKKIVQVDTVKEEALVEGVNKKGEKKIVWVPLRLLKLQKQPTAAGAAPKTA